MLEEKDIKKGNLVRYWCCSQYGLTKGNVYEVSDGFIRKSIVKIINDYGEESHEISAFFERVDANETKISNDERMDLIIKELSILNVDMMQMATVGMKYEINLRIKSLSEELIELQSSLITKLKGEQLC